MSLLRRKRKDRLTTLRYTAGMVQPLVSAVVLNYTSPQDTLRCVHTLLGQSLADQLEILIVDNHSQDDSIGIIRNTFSREPRVRIVESARNGGYGTGNNWGVRYAQGTYLLIINPDNALELQGLERLLHVLERDRTIGLVAPRLVHQDGTVRDSTRAFPTPWDVLVKRTLLRGVFPQRMERYLRKGQDHVERQDVGWVVGACFLIRMDLYRELGGFDERFFLFFEDTDLCRRVWQSGHRVVFVPTVLATDRKGRLSEGGLLSLLTKWTVREHVRSAIRYFWKWKGQQVPETP